MSIKIGSIEIAREKPFVLIAGPCQIESEDHARKMATALANISAREKVDFIFKASFDKANRTSHSSKRGAGMEIGLNILAKIKEEIGCPVISDVHNIEQCAPAAKVLDILQIPAFLSRQTDLLSAAAQTGKPVMVKKGQFLAPDDMKNVAAKITSLGNQNVLLCERGTSFGYHNLVSDMRGLEVMARSGHPVIFDATHSTQSPGGLGGSSGGDRDMAPLLARAALAVGVAGIFVEVHDNPEQAPSDGPAMMRLDEFAHHLRQWKLIDDMVKNF